MLSKVRALMIVWAVDRMLEPHTKGTLTTDGAPRIAYPISISK